MEYYQSLQDAYGSAWGQPAPAPRPKVKTRKSAVERVMQALPIDPGNGMGEPPVYEPFLGGGKPFAWADPSTTPDSQLLGKLNYAIQLMERRGLGHEPTNTHDIILYSFTGIFMLFVLDSFVRLGRRIDKL